MNETEKESNASKALDEIREVLTGYGLAALIVIGWDEDGKVGFASSVVADSSGQAYGWWLDIIRALDRAQEEHDRNKRGYNARWN